LICSTFIYKKQPGCLGNNRATLCCATAQRLDQQSGHPRQQHAGGDPTKNEQGLGLALFIDLVANLARWRTRNASLNGAITVAAWVLFMLGILTLVVFAVKILV
jgi:hypothetical protein